MEGQRVGLRLRALPALQDLLQGGEVRIAGAVVSNDLAIDKAARQVEFGQCFYQKRKFVGPVFPAARVDADVVPLRGDERAVTVEFDFVHPAISGRHFIDQRGELGLAEFGQRRIRSGAFGLARIAVRDLFHLFEKGLFAFPFERIFALLVGGDFRHRATGQDARQLAVDQRIALFGMLVVQLAQQPVLAFFA